MNDEDYRVSRYDGAVLLLPFGMRERARRLTRVDRQTAEEFRLRIGWPPTVMLPEGEISLGGGPVTRDDLSTVLEIATEASAHSSSQQIKRGFLTAKGGYRIGLGGSVFLLDGEVGGYGSFTSAAVRISREVIGAADPLMHGLTDGGFTSTLIIAPPGGGKTTLLRDIIRQLSDGGRDRPEMRVALADERGEIAAVTEGKPSMNVGKRTDILDSCPKARAVMMLLRSMSPQVIALDEITAPEDISSIQMARNCGVYILATAHASSLSDLLSRPLYRDLIQERIFDRFVIIEKADGKRTYRLERGDIK